MLTAKYVTTTDPIDMIAAFAPTAISANPVPPVAKEKNTANPILNAATAIAANAPKNFDQKLALLSIFTNASSSIPNNTF